MGLLKGRVTVLFDLYLRRRVYWTSFVVGMVLYAGGVGAQQQDVRMTVQVNGMEGTGSNSRNFALGEDIGTVDLMVTAELLPQGTTRNGSVSIAIRTVDGFGLNAPALEPDDYIELRGSVEIPAGATSGTATFDLMVVDDNVIEFNEGFLIVTEDPPSGISLDNDRWIITIFDQDVPGIDLELEPSHVFKGDDGTTIVTTVRLASGTLARESMVTLSITGGTAGPTDFDARRPDNSPLGNNFVVAILFQRVSESTRAFVLTPTIDPSAAGEETVIFTAGGSQVNRIGNEDVTSTFENTAVLTIRDRPTVAVGAAGRSLTGSNLDVAVLTATLSGVGYVDPLQPEYFSLIGPQGITVTSVVRNSDTQATLTLEFSGSSADLSSTQLSVIVNRAAHNANQEIISNALPLSLLVINAPASGAFLRPGETTPLSASAVVGDDFQLAGGTLTISVDDDPGAGVTLSIHPDALAGGLSVNDSLVAVSIDAASGTGSIDITSGGESYRISNRVLLRSGAQEIELSLSALNGSGNRVPTAEDLAAFLGAVQLEVADGYRGTVELQIMITEFAEHGGENISARATYRVAPILAFADDRPPPLLAVSGEDVGTLAEGKLPEGTLLLTLEDVEVNLPEGVTFAAGSALNVYLNGPGRMGYLGGDPISTSAVDGETLRINLRRTAPATLSSLEVDPVDGPIFRTYEYRDTDSTPERLVTSRDISTRGDTVLSGNSAGEIVEWGVATLCIGGTSVCPDDPNEINAELELGDPELGIAEFFTNTGNNEQRSDAVVFVFSESGASAAMFEALLDVVEISLIPDANGQLPENSSVTIVLYEEDSGDIAELVLPLAIGDRTPPVVSDPLIRATGVGDTRAMLTWTAASDQAGTLEVPMASDPLSLRYELTWTADGVSQTLTLVGSGDGDNVYALNGNSASFALNRGNAVLLPGKTYTLAMRVIDVAGNAAASGYVGTFTTGLAQPDTDSSGIHDELDAVVEAAGGVSAYCGDSDGVPDNVEVRIGTDCRGDADNDFVGESRPAITISASSPIRVISGHFVHPGASDQTQVQVSAVCDGVVCTSLRAYENTATCRSDPGQAGVDDAACPPVNAAGSSDAGELVLGSFIREVLWVGRDANDNWVTATQQFYIQPPVGFDVGTVAAASAAAAVSLPVSVSADVSDNLAFSVTVTVSGFSAVLTEDTLSRVIAVTPGTATTLGLTFGAATVTPPAGMTLPSGLPATDYFIPGNTAVNVVVREAASAVVPEFTFTPTPPLFIADDAGALPSFRITSDPLSARYEVTAQVLNREVSTLLTVTPTPVMANMNVTIAFNNAVQAGDLIEVRASSPAASLEGSFFVTVTASGLTDVDRDGIPDGDDDLQSDSRRLQVLNEGAPLPYMEVSGVSSGSGDLQLALGGYALAASLEQGDYSAEIPSETTETGTLVGAPPGYPGTGIFDFSVSNVEPGGVISVVIPLVAPVSDSGVQLYKFDAGDGGWNAFIPGGTDRYYGAAPPCPALNAARGGGAGEWREASVSGLETSESGLQAGDGCLLVEITDGGLNDADGARNGVIYDPNALGAPSMGTPPSGAARGGSGAVDPLWLLLFAGLVLLAGAVRARSL